VRECVRVCVCVCVCVCAARARIRWDEIWHIDPSPEPAHRSACVSHLFEAAKSKCKHADGGACTGRGGAIDDGLLHVGSVVVGGEALLNRSAAEYGSARRRRSPEREARHGVQHAEHLPEREEPTEQHEGEQNEAPPTRATPPLGVRPPNIAAPTSPPLSLFLSAGRPSNPPLRISLQILACGKSARRA